MPTAFIIIGLAFTVFAFWLLQLPKNQRTRASLISATIISIVGIFILISGIFLSLSPHS